MKKMEKVTCKTQREFIEEVADDCIKHMSQKDKKYITENPYANDYHFTYCLFLRNKYIHCRDFSEVEWRSEPNNLSYEIMRFIISKLIPEYDYDNYFIERIYDDKRFISLRREYKNMFGEYPNFIIDKYKNDPEFTPIPDLTCLNDMSDEEFEAFEKEYKVICENNQKVEDKLILELAEIIWQTDKIEESIERYGLDYEQVKPRIENIKEVFREKDVFVPWQISLLPYKNVIGKERYSEYKKILLNKIDEDCNVLEKLDSSYFEDRLLTRSVLAKRGSFLRFFPMYQDDEEMVKISIIHNGAAIEYASERFQKDPYWIRFAIEHSDNECIMHLKCMEPFRKDKELVYLACTKDRWNYVWVDKTFYDDYELAKLCMNQKSDDNSIFNYMSPRLRDNKEFALIELNEDLPYVDKFSKRLRNDDDIAAKLFEIHGSEIYVWEYMSKRLQKKYGYE